MLLSVAAGSPLGVGVRRGGVKRLIALTVLCLSGMASFAEAQTANFTGSVVTVLSGFTNPACVAIDGSGNLFVGDISTGSVYEALAAGGYTTVNTIATGIVDGYACLALDTSDNVFITDTSDGLVKEIVAAGGYASVITVATGFSSPTGIAIDANNNLFVASQGDRTIKEILASGGYTTINTLTGGVFNPEGVAVDASGNVFVALPNNGSVEEFVAAGSYLTRVSSNFGGPVGLAVDGSGNVLVADSGGGSVDEMLATGGYTTVNTLGSGFNNPVAVAVDGNGNIFVADYGNGNIKKIQVSAVNFGPAPIATLTPSLVSLTFTFTAGGAISAPAVLTMGAANLDFTDAGTGTCTTNGTSHSYNVGDTCTVDVTFTPKAAGPRYGGVTLTNTSGALIATAYVSGTGTGPQITFSPAVSSSLGSGFNGPCGLAVDGNGNVFLTDSNNNALKEILAVGGYTNVLTLASGFNNPNDVVVDGNGNLFVADAGNNAVKEILAVGGYTNVLTLGSGFNQPNGVGVDGNGNVFVGDTGNHAVKEIMAAGGYTTINSLGGSFGFNAPIGVAADGNGNVFVGDAGHNSVFEILAAGGYTTVYTRGGGFNFPINLVLDGNGNVFVADAGNNAVKEILAAGDYTTVNIVASGLNNSQGVAVDGSGNVFIANTNDNAILKLDFADPPALTFATTGVGNTSSDSPQTVTVTNSGNATLTFPVPMSGLNPSIATGFTIGGSSTCPQLTTSSSTATLAAGASCTYLLDFTPVAAGSIIGSLVATDNALNGVAPNYTTQSVALSGVATGPPIITFSVPNQTYGGAPFTVSATSNSSGAFTYSVVSGPATISGSTVTLTGIGTVVLLASQAASSPFTAGTQNATFLVGGPTANLGSIAIATATPATTSLTFAFATSTTIAAPAVLTMGAANLDFTDAGTGTCTTNGTTHTYNSGDTCTVDVTFTPKFAGPRYGGVTLTNGSGALVATAYLSGTGTGPQVTFSPALQSTPGSGFSGPTGVAVDGNGNIFVADNTAVYEILAAGGYTTVSPVGSGFGGPFGVAVDGNGNIFVADSTNNAVYEILAARGYTTVSTLGSGFNAPSAVAVDGNGNVFVADTGNNAVKEIVAAGGYTTVTPLGSGFYVPYGLAVDASGNIFVADTGNNAVKEILAAGGYTTVIPSLGSGFNNPYGVALDASGNVFVADSANNAVTEILAVGGYTTLVRPLGSGLSFPTGVAVDAYGNVFVADHGNAHVVKLDFADPALTFATTAVGNTSSDSPQTLTLNNYGNATLTLPVPASGLNPSISSGFTIGGSSTCPQLTTSSSAATLAAGASCTYLLNFMPVAIGSASGSLATTDNDLNSAGPRYTTQNITLSGTATGPPTITFTVANQTYGVAPFTVSATSNSSGAFTYSVVSGPATISGSMVTLTGGGTVVLEASQAAAGDYTTGTQNATFTVAGFTTPVTSLGSIAIATATPATTSLTFTFVSSTTIAAPAVLTLGAPNLDFTDAGTGTCTTNGTSHSYSAGDTCTVNVTFTPKVAGPRYGGVTLTNGSGALVASAYLSGSGTGPQVTFSPALPSILGSGFSGPTGVAIDGNGNVFVADTNNNAVKEILAAGGYTTVLTLASGFSGPSDVVVDGNGNLFVADSGNAAVKEILAVGGYTTVHPLGGSFSFPGGVAVDGNGNVFISDEGNNLVQEILAAGDYTTVHTLGSGFNSPGGVAVDGNGNVFVGDTANNAVKEILAAGGYTTVNTLGSGFYSPVNLVLDGNGNLFVADSGNNAVKEILAAGGYTTVNTLESNAGSPNGVAVDGNGNVFIANTNDNTILKMDFADPPALTFATTGVGNTSSDSPQTITINNSGNAALSFPVPTSGLNPSIASGFTIGGSSTCPELTTSSSAATLAAGASCTYLLNFTPVVIGAISGSLTTTDNALNSAGPSYTTQNIALSGTATGPPTITFTVANKTYGVVPFTVSATSNSSGAFTYSVVSGPATISGALVTLTGGGTVVLEASQAASGDYTAGTQNATFTVAGFTTPVTNLGSLAIATATPATTSLTFTFATSTTIAAPAVLTLGAPNLDFTDAGTGTCTTNGTSHTYNSGDTCTVNVTFTPKFAGPRYGGVMLTNISGALVASAYVSGSGTGPQVTFSPAVSSSLGSGFSSPSGIAVDGNGNVFVADSNNGAVYEILAVGGYTTVNTVGSGFANPDAVAVDGNGNVFVADPANNAVEEILAVGGYTTVNTLGAGFYNPTGVAVDGNGNVFVADYYNDQVKEILAAGGYTTINTLASSFEFGGPLGVAVDANGNVFVAAFDNNAVYEILSAGGYTTVNTLGSGIISPVSVAVDANGNVFVADNGNNAVKEILSAGGYTTVNTLESNAGGPNGIAVDASGNVFVSKSTNVIVEKLDFADPPALSFLTTVVGNTSSDSPQTVTVTNSGNATLSFPVPTSGLNPSIASGFTIGGSSTCPQLTTSSSAATLAVGASCTYLLNFTPVAVGAISGSLAPTDTALNGAAPNYTTQSIALSGTGTGPPIITFSVPNHTYGDAPFTVSATSNSSGAFTYAVVSGPATISGALVTLTSGGTVVLQASQAASSPYTTGTQNATLTVAGFATPASNLGSLSIATATPATTSLTFTFGTSTTIAAPAVLTLGAANLDFTDAGTGTCTTNGTSHTYNSGDTCTVNVTFTPTLAGPRYGGVTLTNSSGALIATAYLSGTGTGPQVTYSPAVQSSLGSGFLLPAGVAVDGNGNVFVADSYSHTVKEILAAGGYTTINPIGSGFSVPTGVAVDGNGNVFVADETNNSVTEILAAGGYTTVNTLAGSFVFNTPIGVAVDGNGNVFVTDQGNSAVREIVAAGGYTTVNTLGTGFSQPFGVAVDGNGNVFVTDQGNSAVSEIVAAGGYTTVNTLGSGFSTPAGVAVDRNGNVFVADFDNNAVKEILAAGGYTTVNTVESGFANPTGLTVDGNGNVFVSGFIYGPVVKLDFADPPALSFATTAVGNTSSDSPQTITIRNSGNATLTFPVPTSGLNPSIASGFTIGGSSTCPQLTTSSSAATLTAGASCTYLVNFTPVAADSASGSLATTDNALNSTGPSYTTQSIALSGTGTGPPTITFSVPNHTYGDAPFTVSATSNSAGAFTYSVVSGAATISGSTVTLTGGGAVVLQASEAASGYYAAATQNATFTVAGFTTPVTNLGSLAIATATPATTSLTFTFGTSTTIAPPAVLTLGAPNLDFTDAGTGTCTTNGTSHSYSVGDGCTVNVTFTPKFAGPRYGGVTLTNASGALIASAYLSGVGTGPQVTFSPAVQTTVASGLSFPWGVAVDGNGNIFVADYENSAVKEIPAAGGATVTLGSGFSYPFGVAVDGNGNVFVADSNNSAVKEILAAGGYTTVHTLGSGFGLPFGVAVDGSGNVFVADAGSHAVKEMLAAGGYTTVHTLGSGFNAPTGVAVDRSGNVFVSDQNNNAVYEILAAGGYTTVNSLGSGFIYPSGVAVDASGNVFVADRGHDAVKEILAVGGYTTVNTLESNAGGPADIALDASANVFFTGTSNNLVEKLDFADPPALSFATTAVGSTSSDSPQTVTVTNSGNATLTFPVPTSDLNPTIASGFTIGGSSTCPQLTPSSSAATLAAGASCTYLLNFTPVAIGAISGSLATTDNALNSTGPNYTTQNITLSGTATGPPTITFSVPNHTYGDAPFEVSATSNSYGALTYSVVSGPATISGAIVTLTGGGTVVLASSQTASGDYTAGTQNATLTVAGFATPASNLGSLSIATATPATTSLTFTFGTSTTIAAPAVLTLGAANLDFTDAGTGTCTTNGTSHSYSVGDSCTVDVTFTPKFAGPRYGGVTLTNTSGVLIASAYVSGLGTGPQVTFSPAVSTTLGSGFNTPYGIAVDGTGNVFVADDTAGAVYEILAAGGYTTVNTLGSGFYGPAGIAVDGNGNVFVSDVANNAVKEILAAGGYTIINTVGNGFYGPWGIAVDGNGNVFVADSANHAIKEILGAGGYTTINTLGGSFVFGGPVAVALDGNGNVVVADSSNNAVYEILAAGGYTTVNPLGSGFSYPSGVAVDGSGNVFVSDRGHDAVKEILAVGGYTTVKTLNSNAGSPAGIAVDASANVFFTGTSNNLVEKLDFADPPALSFLSTAVGSISSDSPQTVTVTNSGNATLTFPVPTSGLNPTIASGFTIGGSSTCPQLTTSSSAATLAAGTSCTYLLNFTPVAVGAISGSLAPTDNALNSTGPSYTTQSIALSGTATGPPTITFSVPDHTYGDAPFTVSATSNSSGAFTYSVVSGPATISGSTVTLTAAGAVVLQASEVASGDYFVGTQNATFAVAAASPAIAFTVSNQTYGAAPFAVRATSNSTGAFTYSVISGAATISGATVTLTGAGSVVLQASEAATSNYLAGTRNATVTVAAASPTIAFTVSNQTYGAAPFTVSATSNSTGAFTYSVVSGPAAISGSTLTLTGTGAVVLQASQAASSDYATGTQNATFTVAAGAPNIAFTVANQTYGAAPFTVGATSNSTGAFTYSVVSGPATISGSTLALTGTGTVVLQASEAASSDYATGTQNATFTVAAGTPNITFTVANQTYGAAPFTVSAISNSSGAFTYSVVSGPASISGVTVTVTGAGTVVLQASEASTSNYLVGTRNATVIVATDTPSITFAVPSHTFGDAPFAVSATSNSSGAFTYSVVSGPATISGSTVTITKAGTVVLRASESASVNFSAGSETASFIVATTVGIAPSSGSTSEATVAAGAAATFPLTFTPEGATTFTGKITFSISGLPPGATATFSPASIAAGSPVTPVTLTIQTSSQTGKQRKPSGRDPFASLAWGLLLLPIAGSKRVRRHLRSLPLAMLIVCVLGMLSFVGCGGSVITPVSPAAQTYNLVVTAANAASGVKIITNLTLTVQ